MQYKVIGLMSGSSLDGLDLAYVHFEESGGQWHFDIRETDCIPYPVFWKEKLAGLTGLSARDYLLLHTEYGRFMGGAVNGFIEKKGLAFQVQLIASHGHTSFHLPEKQMTAQLGDGAALAAATGIHTITDFRSTDIAVHGQGAPVVPIGEKLLFGDYDLFLNLGGIANISAKAPNTIGFDVCPANRVLNLLADTPEGFDRNGLLAAAGSVKADLLAALNQLAFYGLSGPKSLSNDFGLKEVYPLIVRAGLSRGDALRTYTEHIALQIARSVDRLPQETPGVRKMLVTGGGAHNRFLVECLEGMLKQNLELVVPDATLIDYKEALIIALMGVLRWRETENVLASVTGADRNSINGAIWSS